MKIAIVWDWCSGSSAFFMPVVKAVGGEHFAFYCNRAVAQNSSPLLHTLEELGVTIHTGEIYSLKSCAYAFCDDRVRPLSPLFIDEGLRCIAYTHATYKPCVAGDKDFCLASSGAQLLSGIGNGLMMRDEHGKIQWGVAGNGAEAAVAGLFHLGEWTTRRYENKQKLQKELEEQLKVSFTPELPVVCCYKDVQADWPPFIPALKQLALHANVIVKGFNGEIEGKNIFHVPSAYFQGNLVRFASDYILSPTTSGLLTTSVMLGQRVIPVYASLYKAYSENYRTEKASTFRALSVKYSLLEELCKHISPINIESTEMLCNRINDAAYWRKYESEIATVQARVFGHYYIDDALERTAKLVHNILEHDTMMSRELAVLNKEIRGPITHRGSENIICL